MEPDLLYLSKTDKSISVLKWPPAERRKKKNSHKDNIKSFTHVWNTFHFYVTQFILDLNLCTHL